MSLHQDILAGRILIVDDQVANVEQLARMLGDAGYTGVGSTMQPMEVGALHRRNDYDLILLELDMPGMDGFAVMEALKANPGDSDLPVVVLTAHPEHKRRALQSGARDFISKPFDLVEVRTRIHNMLEVRLLHRRLAEHAQALERTVLERTAELRASEARYRSLTELASDLYWEQDEHGEFTKVSGPVLEMLGIQAAAPPAGYAVEGRDEEERKALQLIIAAHQPFLDLAFHWPDLDGSRRQFRVSGEPMFDGACRFIGYRGIGVETRAGS